MAKRKAKKAQSDSLGYRLRMTRRERGWTQDHLAEESGTSQAVIQKIENGKSLRPRKIDQIAAALDVDPAWLQFGHAALEDLDAEALKVADAWSKLREPQRSRLKAEILGSK